MRLPRVHRLVNAHGDTVEMLDFGARIRALTLALPDGPRNVVLGYARLEDYLTDRSYIGSTVGRYANRIAGARFSLDGREYRLSANEGANHLHGGIEGFDKRFWELVESTASSVTYRLESPDGDQGYPGSVMAEARFELSDTRELTIRFGATTDAPTYVSLTQHAYFNLDGVMPTGKSDRATQPGNHDDAMPAHKLTGGAPDKLAAAMAKGAPSTPSTLLGHRARIASSRFTPTDAALIPTGKIETVTGTDLDLRAEKRVGDLLVSSDSCIRAARGADVNYVLDDGRPAAELVSGAGDLRMVVETSCPCLQFYTGQNLVAPFEPYAGLCLEAQHFPDAPNRSAFPSALLRPGERYDERVTYRFVG